MPAPAVYAVAIVSTVAAAIAFHQFVYEPHIAPRIEALAEAFLEDRRRRRRQRQGPIPAAPFPAREDRDENRARRSSDSTSDRNRSGVDLSTSVELEELVARETSGWRGQPRSSGLRRRTAAVMDQSNISIPYDPMSPTQVLFDSSLPSSPTMSSAGPSESHGSVAPESPVRSSSLLLRVSPGHNQSAQFDSPVVLSPRLPTPISNISGASSRAVTPTLTDLDSHQSVPSSRAASPDASAPHMASMYNTALLGSVHSVMGAAHRGDDVLSPPAASSRAISPFSDIHSAAARSPMVVSPMVLSPSYSDLELASDSDEDDVLSVRSGMSSPGAAREVAFDLESHDGSEASWASVGRRSPGAEF